MDDHDSDDDADNEDDDNAIDDEGAMRLVRLHSVEFVQGARRMRNLNGVFTSWRIFAAHFRTLRLNALRFQ